MNRTKNMCLKKYVAILKTKVLCDFHLTLISSPQVNFFYQNVFLDTTQLHKKVFNVLHGFKEI